MYDNPKRYENDSLYEDEDTDYEDEYEADDSDYIVDDEDEEDENALWDDAEEDSADKDDTDEPPEKKRRKRKKSVFADSDTDADEAEAEEYEKTRRRLAKEQRIIDEIEADAAENPIEDDSDDSGDEQPERKLLKRELRAQALKRLEDSARTLKDYENLVAWYDRLDANRQRRERYHELFRSGDDVPLDYGASEDALCFPDTLNDVLKRQERKGDFIDTIFYCPYDIHELVTDADMSVILRELNEDHKFLLFLSALRQYSSVKIAAIRGQSDRNIRKVRNTMLKKIRKKLLAALTEKVQAQQPLTLLEKEFLKENGVDIEKTTKK
ncbi:sigma-70 family RNA polymerase sigma factor [Candidatus Avoscillospira sp. LCP25S3_F1]|uniref:sigma-70 family RNA polymerase sigma factor n=1 Tax=Candidatus Avoscillospira sp. LCP25S3_F1 TaxID=3438825 RepID=UPI003F8F3DED